MTFVTTMLMVRNQRILAAWNARQEENTAPRRQRPAPENPRAPPQDTRRAHRHRTALTSQPGPAPTPPARTRTPPQREHARTPENQTRNSKEGASGALHNRPAPGRITPRPECQTQT